jgi:hypothetical protein
MSYTNGFNKTQVLSALVGRLGWSDTSLNATNQTSRSGRYFDDGSFHSLVTVPNIKATAPAQSDWNAYFTARQNAAVLKCLNGVFPSAEYYENAVTLYTRITEQTEAISNSGSLFCGYEIRVAPATDVAVQLNSVTLLMDGAHTFNLYLFQSGKVAPIKTIEVSTNANEYTEVSLTDVFLKYPGTYWIGYFQSDLGIVKALSESVSFAPTYNFGARPFQARENGEDFQRTQVSYTGRPYGINLNVSSFKDYTQAITSQPHLFDEVIGKTFEFMALEAMLTSTEVSPTERNIKDSLDLGALNLYLYGQVAMQDVPRSKGLKVKLDELYAEVRKQFFKQPKAQNITL